MDVERYAARRPRPAEAPEQLVVAAAAADREADGRGVDLEHDAGVVAELANEAEVEDHAVGRAALGQQLVELAQARDGALGGAVDTVEHLRPPAQGRKAGEELCGRVAETETAHARL